MKIRKLVAGWLDAHRRIAFVLLIAPAVAVRGVDVFLDSAKEFWFGCELIWLDAREWAEWSFKKEVKP